MAKRTTTVSGLEVGQVYRSPLPTDAAISQIKGLVKKENSHLISISMDQIASDRSAYQLGKLAAEMVGQAKVSKRKDAVLTIAALCGLSPQAVQDRMNFYYSAATEENQPFFALPRSYYMAIGEYVRPQDDAVSAVIARHLLKTPLLDSVGMPDPARIAKAGRLIKKAKADIMNKYGVDLRTVAPSGSTDHTEANLQQVCHAITGLVSNSEQVQGTLLELGMLFDNLTAYANSTEFTLQLPIEFTPSDIVPEALRCTPINLPVTVEGILFKRRKEDSIRKSLKQTKNAPPVDVSEKIFHGRAQDVLQDATKFPPHSIDLIVTDPPYSKEFYGAGWRSHSTVQHDACDTAAEQAAEFADVMGIILHRKIMKPSFSVFVFLPNALTHVFTPPLLKQFDDAGLEYVFQVLLWDKGICPKTGSGHFSNQVESILYISVGRAMHRMKDGKPNSTPSPLFTYPPAKDGAWKPVSLLKDLIASSTFSHDGSEVVLDCYAGSGSTARAAIELGVDYRLVESNERQYELCKASVTVALGTMPKVAGQSE